MSSPVDPFEPDLAGGSACDGEDGPIAAPVNPAFRVVIAVLDSLSAARGALFPFAPVVVGLGVGAFFLLPRELMLREVGVLAAGMVALAAAALRGPEGARPVAFALALVCAGTLLAAWRAQSVAAPVIGWHRYGPVEGRIVMVDRSGSDAVQLTLDRVVLPGVDPARVPARVRVSVHGTLELDPVVGTRVMLTGHLAPPGGPVEPGGFDFRRLAWFDQLGAVGYTRSPVLALEDPAPGLALALTRLRQRLADGIRARLPGETGGFVAAILTGDRSGVGLETIEDLRRSNLAHLLAISGLHMGLLTGVVYATLRAALAMFPLLALRLPIRKLAALGPLLAAAAYLALSGGNVATQRAFVMAAAMLGAVLAERRALSMRSVALAALILLAWRPEALLSVGFHMSFAATVALVAVFRWLRDRRMGELRVRPSGWRRALAPVGSAALCSLVAGVATAPFAAAQFHRVVEYGLIANLLSVPLMGLLVMPAAVLAAVLWPVGLEGIGLWLMGLGTRWILGVANRIGNWDGAVTMVVTPPGWVVPVLSLGALWLVLWPGRARLAGVLVVAVALGGWGLAERPPLLIDGEGSLVGLMGPQGRALSRARGAGFVARNWLEADGDEAWQEQAAARAGFTPVEGGVRFHFAGRDWAHLTGRRGLAALSVQCRDGAVVVIDQRVDAPPQGCRLLDPRALRATGAIAVAADGHEVTARETAGRRLWSGW